jgi:NADPH:quinone reductase
MRAAVITAPGGPEVLQIQQRPRPRLGDPEATVLVRVVGSALNRADLIQRAGHYPAPSGAPADIPGLEFAGEVAEVADGVRQWRPGDRVFGLVPGGAHAEYLTTHPDTLARVPDTLDLHTAGALPEACITAHDALRQARFAPGERVLIHAVASGVGLAAVQLVRALGGIPYGTARSPAKFEQATALGLEAGIVPERADDGHPRFADAVLTATDGRGVDVVLDLVGGRYVAEGVRGMAHRGRLVLIGLLAGRDSALDLSRVLSRRLQITGTVLRARALDERIAFTRAFVDDVVPLLADGRVRAIIERSFELDDIAAAHALLGGNETTGKLALRIAD